MVKIPPLHLTLAWADAKVDQKEYPRESFNQTVKVDYRDF